MVRWYSKTFAWNGVLNEGRKTRGWTEKERREERYGFNDVGTNVIRLARCFDGYTILHILDHIPEVVCLAGVSEVLFVGIASVV